MNPEDNWTERINRMKNILNGWKERSLTMKGKAVVVHSHIGGNLAYYGSVLSCPNDMTIRKCITYHAILFVIKTRQNQERHYKGPSRIRINQHRMQNIEALK